ncbi:MAG: hypothetical protein PHF86_12630 [Candidatus Nanoarchaeia archaeon]|jgi:citrate synthase|nr:hypothetical protein [Candidatus Nanoarchaeia archaeon]
MELQELQLLIRSKNFDEATTFKLFEISRRSTTDEIIEGLLDELNHNSASDYAELETKIDELEEQIGELRIQNAHLKEEQEQQEIEEVVSAGTFEEFVEKFQEENDRYPSIDETWKACESRK